MRTTVIQILFLKGLQIKIKLIKIALLPIHKKVGFVINAMVLLWRQKRLSKYQQDGVGTNLILLTQDCIIYKLFNVDSDKHNFSF